jgi:hypothetical protein
MPCVGSLGAAVAMIGGVLLAAAPARADPRPRLVAALAGGWDAPLGTGGLSLALESAGGWGVGLGAGMSSLGPSRSPWHLGGFARIPVVRLGAFEVGGLLFASRAHREVEVNYPPPDPSLPEYLRWEWRPGYRLDVAASARYRMGPWSLRTDAGVGYVVNDPSCESFASGAFVSDVDCSDARIPAQRRAADAPSLVPFGALALEYDVGGPSSRDATTPAADARAPHPARSPDARRTNAWLAPTALTLARGEARVTLYELLVADVAVGLTDALQVSAAVGYLGVTVWRGEIKYALIASGRLRLAAVGGAIGFFGDYDSSGAYVGVGPAISFCLDERCDSLISMAAHGGVGWSNPDEGSSSRERGVLVSPSVALALPLRLKLVGELHWFAGHDELVSLAMLRVPVGERFNLEAGVLLGEQQPLPIGSLSWRL